MSKKLILSLSAPVMNLKWWKCSFLSNLMHLEISCIMVECIYFHSHEMFFETNQTSINETIVVGRNDLMILTFKPDWLTLTDRGYFISPKKISAFQSGWDSECIFLLKTRFSTENRINLARRKARIEIFISRKFSPI